MRRFLLLLLILVPRATYAQATLQPGIIDSSLSANAGGAGTNGISFATYPVASVLSWQVSFSSAPASDTILLQGAFDNATWFTLDTSTNTAGEIRTVQSAVPFVRCNINAKSGGGTTTCSFSTKVIQGFNNTGNSPSILFGDGSVASPSISFSNEPSSGLYRASAGNVNLSILGVPKISVSAGNTILGNNLSVPSTGSLGASSNFFITGVASGQLKLQNDAVNSGVGLDVTTDQTLKLLNRAVTTGMELNLGVPTLGTCTGGSLTSGSHNFAGEITATTGGSCVINFGAPNFTNAPFCTAVDESATPTALQLSARSASSITIANITSGHNINWICIGRIGT